MNIKFEQNYWWGVVSGAVVSTMLTLLACGILSDNDESSIDDKTHPTYKGEIKYPFDKNGVSCQSVMVPVGRMNIAKEIISLRDAEAHVYRRLQDYKNENDDTMRQMLGVEVATDIRRTMEGGVRCILDCHMKVSYEDGKLSDLIDKCLPFVGGETVESLHRTRRLCNYLVHDEDIHGNISGKLMCAVKTPGLLLRFIEDKYNSEMVDGRI